MQKPKADRATSAIVHSWPWQLGAWVKWTDTGFVSRIQLRLALKPAEGLSLFRKAFSSICRRIFIFSLVGFKGNLSLLQICFCIFSKRLKQREVFIVSNAAFRFATAKATTRASHSKAHRHGSKSKSCPWRTSQSPLK